MYTIYNFRTESDYVTDDPRVSSEVQKEIRASSRGYNYKTSLPNSFRVRLTRHNLYDFLRHGDVCLLKREDCKSINTIVQVRRFCGFLPRIYLRVIDNPLDLALHIDKQNKLKNRKKRNKKESPCAPVCG